MSNEEALARVREAVEAERKASRVQENARLDLWMAVRAAHDAKVSQAKLAKETHLHRNTIAAWCK